MSGQSQLEKASGLHTSGREAYVRGDLTAAERLLRQALEIRERFAPDSLPVAACLDALGRVARSRGDLVTAEDLHRRSLAIRQELTPGGLDVAESLHNLGVVAWERGDLTTAEKLYRRSLAIREKLAPASLDVARSLSNLGAVARQRGDLAVAEDLYRRSQAITEKLAPEGLDVLAATLNNLGIIAEIRGDLLSAEEWVRRSLAIVERLSPGSLNVAKRLSALGNIASSRGDLAKAEELHRRSLAIAERLAPGSLDVAASLDNLATVALSRGDLSAAEDLYRRSMAIEDKLAPRSLGVAAKLNALGNIAQSRGDLARAEDMIRRSLAIRERLAPGSPDVAASLSDLGSVAQSRGDLSAAEDLYRRSMLIQEKLAPGGRAFAASLGNLGIVAQARGDLSAAEDLYRRSLALLEMLAPGGLDVAVSLNNLAMLLQVRGDLSAAEDLLRRSLAIKERLAPESLDVAMSLFNLGAVAQIGGDRAAAADAYERSASILLRLAPDSLDFAKLIDNSALMARGDGDLALSEDLNRRSLAIKERRAPGSLEVAATFNNGGLIAQDRGDLAAAEALYRRAVVIKEKLAPGTVELARSLNNLGRVMRRQGRREEARTHLCRAVDELEAQTAKLGGTDESRSDFSAGWVYMYRDCEAILLELAEGAEAFRVLERSRARSLVAMLAERDLVSAELPRELDQERRLTNTEYDRTQEVLGRLSLTKDDAKVVGLQSRLRELRDRQQQIAAKIRRASPRLAALQYPQPLDLPGTRGSLGPGTVLLSYSVGEEKSTLYVVRPPGTGPPGDSGLSVFPIPLGAEALRMKVLALRGAFSRGVSPGRGIVLQDAAPASVGEIESRELYELFVRPAEGLVGAAQRILVSPDGPLHTLPFAALRRSNGASSQYLVEWKPIHVVVSATVYAQLKQGRRVADSGPVRLAAFGDPRYLSVSRDSGQRVFDPEVRSVVRSGARLRPLPFTRPEVEGIARLYGDSSQTYLGSEATEGRAKGIGNDVRIVHFATHGLLDERFPLNSALALTIPESPKEGEDNGLLQAWEIFERVRLDADLVVLSACETGLGKETGGEGLVGLTRAFQYAGARTVVASLWSVADESTAQLMKIFYGALKAGRTKDEALREAQSSLLKNPKTAHPFHWGAFQIIGDWK